MEDDIYNYDGGVPQRPQQYKPPRRHKGRNITHGPQHPDTRRVATQTRLRTTLAARAQSDATANLVAAATPAPAPAAAPESMEELEAQFQELGGDVDALVRRLQLPPEVAAAAREYAATDEQHRDLDRIVGSLAALP
jgi:hypothetical protein